VTRIRASAPLFQSGAGPNVGVQVLEREPFGGPLRLQVESGPECILDAELAREIWVDAAPNVPRAPPAAAPASGRPNNLRYRMNAMEKTIRTPTEPTVTVVHSGDTITLTAAAEVLGGKTKKGFFARILPLPGSCFYCFGRLYDPGNFATNIAGGAKFGTSSSGSSSPAT